MTTKKSSTAETTRTSTKVGKRAPAKLLSGGNPQIAKGHGDEPVQAYIAAIPDWKGTVCAELDALIERAVPKVKKAVKWNTPFYGLDGETWFVAYHCITKYVKVSFMMGAHLDPLPPVASKQKNVRYYHVHEGEAIDTKQFTRWVKQAAKLPGEKL
ncbi:MAG: DUF1801 domain-containing protein [Flavobacteriales bacterium]